MTVPDTNTHSPDPHDDTIPNTALFPRPKPRTTAEYITEFAKTGNPVAWMIMRALESRFEFRPDYVPEGGEQGLRLQSPIKYGLKQFRVKDLHLDSGEHVTAWYKPAREGYPTIAYCHGNAGSLDFRAAILKEVTDRGFGVIIAAYPGFKGHRDHANIEPCENACYATGHAMVRYLVNTKQIPMDNIVLFGESLGGAVALRTAYNIEKGIPELGYEPQKVPAVVCFNTFTSLIKRAKEQFPMLPADYLMNNRFESDKIIGDIEAPIRLIHGKDDTYTRYGHSLKLARLSKGNATCELLDGVTHAATYPDTDQKDPEQIRRVVDAAHQYIYDLGLCPEPPLKKADSPEHPADWQQQVAHSRQDASKTSCPDRL